MGFRFRRSVRLTKGIRLNIGKRSLGFSFGAPDTKASVGTEDRTARRVGTSETDPSYVNSFSAKAKTQPEKADQHSDTPETGMSEEGPSIRCFPKESADGRRHLFVCQLACPARFRGRGRCFRNCHRHHLDQFGDTQRSGVPILPFAAPFCSGGKDAFHPIGNHRFCPPADSSCLVGHRRDDQTDPRSGASAADYRFRSLFGYFCGPSRRRGRFPAFLHRGHGLCFRQRHKVSQRRRLQRNAKPTGNARRRGRFRRLHGMFRLRSSGTIKTGCPSRAAVSPRYRGGRKTGESHQGYNKNTAQESKFPGGLYFLHLLFSAFRQQKKPRHGTLLHSAAGLWWLPN